MVYAAGQQIAAANAERNRIKALTIEMPAPSTSTTATTKAAPKRVIVPQDSGFAEGGYTGSGNKYEPAGIVHRGEYVVPQWVMQKTPAINYVRALEAIRTDGRSVAQTASNKSRGGVRGYAEGGYVAPDGANINTTELTAIMRELNTTLQWYKSHNIRADVVLTEFEAQQKKMATIKNNTNI
jgi:hypothetical protein